MAISPIVVSGIIKGLSAIAGTAMNVAASKRSEERQNLYNIDAENRQQMYINKQNEYNSPDAQMKRFQAAGLNPYLVDDPGNQGTITDAIANESQNIGSDIQQGIQSVGDAASETANNYSDALLREKQYQLDISKMEAEKARFDAELNERVRQFNITSAREDADRAYQETRDAIEDNFRSQEMSIKESQLSLEQQKLALQELNDNRAHELAVAKDQRDAEMSRLQRESVRQSNQYNADLYDFFKEFQLPNDKLKSRLEKACLDLSDDELRFVKDASVKSYELRGKMLRNQISFEDYKSGLYKIWDKSRLTPFHRYSNGSWFMNNPYEEDRGTKSSILDAIDIGKSLFMSK